MSGDLINWTGVSGFGVNGMHVDKPVEGGEKAGRRILHTRLVQDGERTYTAYSADELIELDSLARHGRPGMPY